MGPISSNVTLHLAEMVGMNKHSSLFGQFVSCKENGVLQIRLLILLANMGLGCNGALSPTRWCYQSQV